MTRFQNSADEGFTLSRETLSSTLRQLDETLPWPEMEQELSKHLTNVWKPISSSSMVRIAAAQRLLQLRDRDIASLIASSRTMQQFANLEINPLSIPTQQHIMAFRHQLEILGADEDFERLVLPLRQSLAGPRKHLHSRFSWRWIWVPMVVLLGLTTTFTYFKYIHPRLQAHHVIDIINKATDEEKLVWRPDKAFGRRTEAMPEGVINVDGRILPTLQQAFRAAKDGSVIRLSPGRYRQAGTLRANNVKILGSPGSVIYGAQVEGKGALLVQGDNTYIEGIECHSVFVNDNNGACVRIEGRGLHLNGVYFHDGQGAVVGGQNGGSVIIENSRIENMATGYFYHGIYIFDGADSVVIRNSVFLNTQNGGHEVKSRARHTEIENSIIAAPQSQDSRLVDVPNGGTLILRDNVFIEGPNSENSDLFSWGVEGKKHDGSITIEGNLIISDKPIANLIALKGTPISMSVRNNQVAGRILGIDGDSNLVFGDRQSAGLMPIPAIPRLEDIEQYRHSAVPGGLKTLN